MRRPPTPVVRGDAGVQRLVPASLRWPGTAPLRSRLGWRPDRPAARRAGWRWVWSPAFPPAAGPARSWPGSSLPRIDVRASQPPSVGRSPDGRDHCSRPPSNLGEADRPAGSGPALVDRAGPSPAGAECPPMRWVPVTVGRRVRGGHRYFELRTPAGRGPSGHRRLWPWRRGRGRLGIDRRRHPGDPTGPPAPSTPTPPSPPPSGPSPATSPPPARSTRPGSKPPPAIGATRWLTMASPPTLSCVRAGQVAGC